MDSSNSKCEEKPERGALGRMAVTYRVRSDAASIEARAEAIAIEQSVETPLAAISDETVLRDIVGEVQGIRELEAGLFEVRIGLAVETTGFEAGQLLNMLFGNTSMQEDVTLHDAEIPDAMAARFGGPNVGIAGLRAKCGAGARAFTCAALKPQGLPPRELASLAGRLAAGGIDFIKDDHGIADQAYSPFADRVRACAEAVRQAKSGTLYVPNISGSLDVAAAQIALAIDGGHRGGDGRAHDPRRFELSPARARVPEYGVLRPPRHGGRVADRAASPARQAVPPFRRGRHHLPELWRALQLFARNVPCSRRCGAARLVWP